LKAAAGLVSTQPAQEARRLILAAGDYFVAERIQFSASYPLSIIGDAMHGWARLVAISPNATIVFKNVGDLFVAKVVFSTFETGAVVFDGRADNVTFQNCWWTENAITGAGGAAISFLGDKITLRECKFAKNNAIGAKGAFSIKGGAVIIKLTSVTTQPTVLIESCEFTRSYPSLFSSKPRELPFFLTFEMTFPEQKIKFLRIRHSASPKEELLESNLMIMESFKPPLILRFTSMQRRFTPMPFRCMWGTGHKPTQDHSCLLEHSVLHSFPRFISRLIRLLLQVLKCTRPEFDLCHRPVERFPLFLRIQTRL
jgi:hypothetical protein